MKKKKELSKAVTITSEKIDSIMDTMEKYDINSQTKGAIISVVNWFIAIGTGLFIAVLSSLDKLTIKGEIPEKYILVICLFQVGIGLLLLSLIRLNSLFQDILLLNAKGIINKIRYKIKMHKIDENDNEKLQRQFHIYLEMTDKGITLDSVKTGIISLSFGLLTFIGYFIYIIIRYK